MAAGPRKGTDVLGLLVTQQVVLGVCLLCSVTRKGPGWVWPSRGGAWVDSINTSWGAGLEKVEQVGTEPRNKAWRGRPVAPGQQHRLGRSCAVVRRAG